ncbi:MAG TPA: Lrp/AsnC family transcriptional regulator [Nocardioidaceae bacterium]
MDATITAYLLIQTGVGAVEEVLGTVVADPGVSWADPVTGPYDMVAAISAPLGEVIPRLQDKLSGSGAVRTVTCPTPHG